ncbi:unnamed protein product [Porites lobata]|uniref:Transcription initiation factor IIF subunit alpha n=1 Tax=Porites lobata TaxID=104759 RepID=A0ABN8SAN7_9CNID|nr:unnamed protein product [Porites lobata]
MTGVELWHGDKKKKKKSGSGSSTSSNSRSSTPTISTDGAANTIAAAATKLSLQGITEEAVRRYLTRKPMTSKDLLQKFKSKRTDLSNDETVKKLAAIVRKIQPEQKTIKGKLYLSLKPQS